MDRQTGLMLANMTCAFYRANAGSFSATRQAPWEGWRRLPIDPGTERVVDLACGNLRFERFLAGRLAGLPAEQPAGRGLRVCGLDNCRDLVDKGEVAAAGEAMAVDFHEVDIVGDLIADKGAALAGLGLADYDLAVCFGFFHHLPTGKARRLALDLLIRWLRPGGRAALSLWRFADDPTARDKADRSTDRALQALAAQGVDIADQLGPGDYLLGWQHTTETFRYCHSFSDEEVEGLVSSVSPRARLIDRYRADGKTGASNEYLIFEV